MASDDAPTELRLLQTPWLPVNIGGCHFMSKSWFGEAEYHVLLTDMKCMWEERMGTLDIQDRAQELNRRLRAPVSAFFSHLRQVAEPCLTGSGERRHPEAQISLTRQEDENILMKLKSELAGLPFHWEFHCTPTAVTLACVQLLRPLLAMSRLLQRQVEQLGRLLVHKDTEIQDYRENGATLSRERLQTDVFEEQMYRDDFMAKTLPLLLSERQDSLGFDADLQRLYAAVVSHHTAPSRKRRPSEESSAEDQDRPPTETTSALGVEPTDQKTAPEEEKASRPKGQQSVSTTSTSSADRPSSKPKKKKVGLFR